MKKGETKETNMGQLKGQIQRRIAERGRERFFKQSGGLGFGNERANSILNGRAKNKSTFSRSKYN